MPEGRLVLDLAALQVFLTVAQERSFSRAAQKLFRTQPAVSIAIRKLEEWVGQPLFVRGSRSGQLTEAGVLLREYAERMLNLREEIRRGIDDLQKVRQGELSIGANESSIHALLPALAEYRQLYPNLVAVEFMRDELAFVVPPKHRLAKRRTVGVKDLGDESFVAHIVESPYRQRVMQLFARHRTTLHMDVELPTIESIKLFVEMNRGVAIVPRMCVKMELERGSLVELRIRQMHFPRHLFVLYRRDRALSHAARAFMRLLRAG
jgi:DNA-binding transcriptional LysR family regulator